MGPTSQTKRTLEQYLKGWSAGDDRRRDIATSLGEIAKASIALSRRIAAHVATATADGADGATGADATGADTTVADATVGSDSPTPQDFAQGAHKLMCSALERAPVAYIASEKHDAPIATANTGAPLVVAIDPLDGFLNIDTNLTLGTIFSLLPARDGDEGEGAGERQFLQPGNNQLAAGYVIYGPQTLMMLSLGEGCREFRLEPGGERFVETGRAIAVPPKTNEFAINASNSRFWDDRITSYVSDCLAGENGPAGQNYNMRWLGSLVAEAHRILARGGVFLYPSDLRPGYARGRLRLVFEANPIALLIEQAGGMASNGCEGLLDRVPGSLDERSPVVFGSRLEVERVERYCRQERFLGERSPLFGRRGLFRM